MPNSNLLELPAGSVVEDARSGVQYTVKKRDRYTPRGTVPIEPSGWLHLDEIERVISVPSNEDVTETFPGSVFAHNVAVARRVAEKQLEESEDSLTDSEIVFAYNVAAARLAAVQNRTLYFDYKGVNDSYPRPRGVEVEHVLTGTKGTLIIGKDIDDWDEATGDEPIKAFRVDRIDGQVEL